MNTSIEELEKKIEENTKNIIGNANRIESNLSKIQENSYALEIVKDYKRSNQRLYIIIILLILSIVILGIHHIIGC